MRVRNFLLRVAMLSKKFDKIFLGERGVQLFSLSA